ncbi:MAG: (Fe-S)-binding protein [Candidatus Desulfofervidus auxilii]|nr:(Fe-S)-binding protein [Candidatus Desulfofervidus auxilii]
MVQTDVEAKDLYEIFKEKVYGMVDGEKIKQCLQCGTCSASCPFGEGMDYNTRKMIAAMRIGDFDEILSGHGIWLCTSCYICTTRCPAKIPLTDVMVPVLRETAMLYEKGVPLELQKALENVARYGNPFGESPKKRINWVKETGVPIKILQKDKKPVNILLIPECFCAYHQRAKNVAISLAKIFHKLNVDFGIIGPDEKCIGDSKRLAGEFGLFEMLAEYNAKQLKKYNFDIIITPDPHAYNAFVNEYPKLGYTYKVLHHTQYLFQRLDDLKPLFKKEFPYKVTYHDPCYLGRRNKVFDAPREILKSINGLNFIEMPRTREDALCCGGGGGGVWLDSFSRKYIKERPAEKRVKEALSIGAEVLAVACPIDITMFEDAVKVLNLEGKIRIMDISEILLEVIGG